VMWYDWVFAICPIVIAVRPLPSGLFYTCTLNKNAEARPPPHSHHCYSVFTTTCLDISVTCR
jgi:hypothetical protein